MREISSPHCCDRQQETKRVKSFPTLKGDFKRLQKDLNAQSFVEKDVYLGRDHVAGRVQVDSSVAHMEPTKAFIPKGANGSGLVGPRKI